MRGRTKLLFLTDQMNTPINHISGAYNIPRMRELAQLGYDVKIVCPIRLTPPMRFIYPVPNVAAVVGHLAKHLALPSEGEVEGFTTFFLKYLALPRRFWWYHEVVFLHAFCGGFIRELTKTYNPDIIVTSWLHPFGTYSKYLRRYFSGPIISYAEGSDVLIHPDKYAGWSYIERILNRNVDKVILISREMERFVLEKRDLRNTYLIVDGYDESRFRYRHHPNKEKLCKILTVGSLVHVKGHDILVAALAQLGPEFSLTIIGSGPQKDKLLRTARKLRLMDRLRIIDFVSHANLHEYIDDADIFCMPSRSDALPAAALEAMACGRPLIGAKVGGLKDIIIHGFNGLHFESKRPESLARTIKKASKSSWDYAEIAGWTRRNYGWSRSMRALDSLIRTEIEEHYGSS